MAEVFEVADPDSGEHLALKLLVQAGSALPRFNREYEAMTRLNHPAIVRVYHYGIHENMPWLTMEFLEGVPLQSRVKSMGRPGSPERNLEVLRVSWQLAEALDYVHSRGLVHRDLKSANVLCLPDGRVKLVDFGTAHLQNPIEMITQEGEFVGTFAYASPEQLTGQGVDFRADLYSFGVLLYRLATGKRPFDAKTPQELARLHVKVMPHPPRSLVPNLPEQLDQAIMWLLQKRPEDRPNGAMQAAYLLQQCTEIPLSVLPGSGIAVSSERPTGRDRQTREALAALDAKEPARCLLVAGGDGSGRLGFCEQLAGAARVDGWRVFSTTLREGRDLSQTVAMLRDAATAAGAHRVAATLRTLLLTEELEMPYQRAALLDACRSAATEVSKRVKEPVLFVVQQLQLAGPVLLEVLADMRRELRSEQSLVCFMGSTDLSVDDPWSPLKRRWSDAHRVDLGPLSARQTALAVGQMLHRRPPPAELARRIHAASGGQPAFIEEIVRKLVQSEVLRIHDDDGNRLTWDSADIGDIPLAESAWSSLDRSLQLVPVAWRRVLEALAVAGGEVPVDRLARALGMSFDGLEVIHRGLMKGGWLRIDDEEEDELDEDELGATEVDFLATLALGRQLAGQVLLAQLSRPRRRLLERQLVDVLAELDSTPALVRLLLSTGRIPEAVARALDCAEQLVAAGRVARALEVLDLVSEHLGDDDGLTNNDRARLYLVHSRCMMAVRPTDFGTARTLMKAAQLAEDPVLASRVDLARARMQWIIGHYPNFRKFCQAAFDRIPEDRGHDVAGVVAGNLAQAYLWSGQPKTAGEWYEKAHERARLSGDPVAIARAQVGTGTVCYVHGELVQAEKLLDEARVVFEAERDSRGRWELLPTWAAVLRLQGRYTEILDLLYERLPRARQDQSSSHYVRLLLATAMCEVDLARLGRAQECLDELDATLHKGEYLHLRVEAGLVRGRILMVSGQFYDAEMALREAQERAHTSELHILAERTRAVLGETLWYMGRLDEARDAFQGAYLGLLGTTDVSALAEACVHRARVQAEEVDAQELFRPVMDKLESEPMRVVLLEAQLASARRGFAVGDVAGAQRSLEHAMVTLNGIAKQLGGTDQAALRVHPWAQQIRSGLR